MKKLVLLLLVTLMGVTVQAQEKKKKKNAKYEIEVKGNCDMCKKRIEKAAFGVSGVKYAAWHEHHQDLHLILDENKCTIDDVRKAIAKTGHDTDKVKAKDADYKGLHDCCQYKRE
ncbi:heavy-metal-associated domain-containing protein [Flavobacterium litorale]|uniref:Metal transporter n=1 Tax=Flavobacterium litorale TaxID=2856519 RepID=A0ABX8V951_9FLAO|nr:metal transporter [Flavobacterium litorale]QYJ67181.1 metal transporter [Flavobacterium litorale]